MAQLQGRREGDIISFQKIRGQENIWKWYNHRKLPNKCSCNQLSAQNHNLNENFTHFHRFKRILFLKLDFPLLCNDTIFGAIFEFFISG